MKYTGQFLWPPRPEVAQAPTLMHAFEQQGWWAQAKMNGNCLLLGISPSGEIFPYTRHGTEPTRWRPGESCRELSQWLVGKGWHVFVGELLHTAGPHGEAIKDTIYIFDILVAEDEYLVGVSHKTRQEKLAKVLAWPFTVYADSWRSPTWTHKQIMPGIWLAKNHSGHFRQLWDNPPGQYVEGLVFKNPDTRLKLCSSKSANSAGMAKCRYATNELAY